MLAQKPDRTLYWLNVSMGTPGQKQSLQLDTASVGLLVPATGSNLCSATAVLCSILGSFTSLLSSTFSDTNQQTTEGFLDGSSVTGDWIYDTLTLGGVSVASQLAVLGTSGTGISNGVMGIGFPASYPTVNHNLAAQGKISSNSYSLWLDSLVSIKWHDSFWRPNTARFIPPLKQVPVIGSQRSDGSTSYNSPTIQLTGVSTTAGSVTTGQIGSGYSVEAILDTGTTTTVLPSDVATNIINALGAMYYPIGGTSGNAVILCSAASGSQSVGFQFGGSSGPSINVPISELVFGNLGSLNGIAYCQFGIYSAPSSDNLPTIMGDTFLRSAYVVYHLDADTIGLAQTNHNGGSPKIIELPQSGIPST